MMESQNVDRIKLKLMGISDVVGIDDISLLSLVDEAEERQLIVSCDKMMGRQIQLRMMDKPGLEHLYPEVMTKMLLAQSSQQMEVMIYDLREGTYRTEVIDTLTGKKYPIRCSDGIFFSLLMDCPLFASRSVMLKQAANYHPGSAKVALPINVISDKMLRFSLDKAIEMEDYEMASNLRDELKKRHPDKNKKSSNP